MHATEAGKDTELNEMRESIPKQIARTHTTPNGTYNQAVRVLCHDDLATCNVKSC